ncbi:restriction endonuclease subunit S [Achromobacter seleniivolatilans]|uniref:Restriction endonuclease subunit S n=1 Tax=Achromobacter seleniivolatilans TaxID=3047478 RepID=A0ABY9M3M2_9BURK|nr:hypothetical protein [Achromobacter sp. R39]WMD21607.1 restriction endonuclease subunit S [Achromobacter sp. R39]
MSDLPKGWAESTLGELVTLRGDKVDPADVPEKSFLGLEDIEPHTSAILRVGKASEVKSSVACFEAGDVLYSRLRPYLNKVARPDFSGVASAEILVLKPSDAVEAEFVRRKIMTREFLDFTAMLDRGDRPRVSYDEIGAFQLLLPPLPEQRQIVAKLDSLTGISRRARDHLDHIPRLVEKYKQAILAAAFRGDLTRGMMEKGDGVQLSDEIDPLALHVDELPTGWGWTSIGAVGQVTGGLTQHSSRKSLPKQVPYMRVANVYANELRLVDIAHIGCTEAEYQRTLLRTGDLLVVEGNGSIDQIGRVAIWNNEVHGCLHQNHLIRISLDGAVSPEFALFWLLSPGGRTGIEAVASSSSGLHTLSISKVKGLPIPVCSEAEQVEIVRRIKSAFAWVERLSIDTNNSRKLVDRLDQSLLAKAFRGELVPQDPTDEPASDLLERIRSERAAAPKAKRGRKKAA